MSADIRRIASHTHFEHPRFRLIEATFATPDGPITRPIIHHPGAVGIIAQPDREHLVCVRQYRYPLGAWTLEIPAGTMTPGEAPLVTARRELEEEAGLIAARWTELLAFYPAPGGSDERMVLFRAEDLASGTARPDHGELVAPETIALADVPGHLASGAINDAKTLIALALIGAWPVPEPR